MADGIYQCQWAAADRTGCCVVPRFLPSCDHVRLLDGCATTPVPVGLKLEQMANQASHRLPVVVARTYNELLLRASITITLCCVRGCVTHDTSSEWLMHGSSARTVHEQSSLIICRIGRRALSLSPRG